MMKLIDITTIQTFKIPPSVAVLKEANDTLILANEKLTIKNDTLKKLLIVSLIIIPILGIALYRKNKTSNNKKQKI